MVDYKKWKLYQYFARPTQKTTAVQTAAKGTITVMKEPPVAVKEKVNFLQTAAVYPEVLLQELVGKQSELTRADKIQNKNIFGFKNENYPEVQSYQALVRHQRTIIDVSQRVYEEIGERPIALIPISDLRKLVFQTPG